MKKSILALTVLATSSAAIAQGPYYVRGEFEIPCVSPPAIWENSCDPMVQIGANAYMYTVTGLFSPTEYEFKCTVDDWTMSAPGSNAKAAADALDELTVYLFDQNTHGDGWLPEDQWRVGYDDSGVFGWEIAGAMNNWDPVAGEWELTHMGSGLHTGDFVIPAGTYEWKFRQQGNWSISIGDNFGNSAGNNTVIVPRSGPVRFELDLPNGRFRVITESVCYPDCDQSTGAGVLDIFDFLCFQSSFVAGEAYACDCDTSTGPLVCDIFDFLCFQGAFVAGCP